MVQRKGGGDCGSRIATARKLGTGLDASRVMPRYILRFFFTLYQDFELYENAAKFR